MQTVLTVHILTYITYVHTYLCPCSHACPKCSHVGHCYVHRYVRSVFTVCTCTYSYEVVLYRHIIHIHCICYTLLYTTHSVLYSTYVHTFSVRTCVHTIEYATYVRMYVCCMYVVVSRTMPESGPPPSHCSSCFWSSYAITLR